MVYFKRLTSILFGIFVISFLYNKVHFQYGLVDTFARTFLSILEDTVWSPKFNEEKFSQIKIGMSKNEVINILDLPLKEFCDQESCLLSYSRQKDGVSSYDRRDIFLNEKRKVTSIAREFWID